MINKYHNYHTLPLSLKVLCPLQKPRCLKNEKKEMPAVRLAPNVGHQHNNEPKPIIHPPRYLKFLFLLLPAHAKMLGKCYVHFVVFSTTSIYVSPSVFANPPKAGLGLLSVPALFETRVPSSQWRPLWVRGELENRPAVFPACRKRRLKGTASLPWAATRVRCRRKGSW